MFCQMTYSPGASAVTGWRYAEQIQMARMVFFCPRDCPLAMVSLEERPMALPVKNWNRQATREPVARRMSV